MPIRPSDKSRYCTISLIGCDASGAYAPGPDDEEEQVEIQTLEPVIANRFDCWAYVLLKFKSYSKLPTCNTTIQSNFTQFGNFALKLMHVITYPANVENMVNS